MLPIVIAVCAFYGWLLDSKEDRKALSDWAAGYKDGKRGPKGGAPIGAGVTYEYKNGFREARETMEYVEGFGGRKS